MADGRDTVSHNKSIFCRLALEISALFKINCGGLKDTVNLLVLVSPEDIFATISDVFIFLPF
jgi:hypothetical protein